MTFADVDQLRYYLRKLRKTESKLARAERAIQYAKEDRRIADINHHLMGTPRPGGV